MCDQLGSLRQALGRYSATFEPGVLTLASAQQVVADATAMANMAATIQALAAARVAGGDGRRGAERLAAEALAALAGTSAGAAQDTIALGRRLGAQEQVGAAARSGQLSVPQLAALSEAVAAKPDAEHRLVATATTATLAELRDDAARVKAAAHPDPDARRAQIRAARSFRSWVDGGGVGHLHAQGNIEDIAQITAAVATGAQDIFHQARRQGRREPAQAYNFDALVQLALNATTTGHHQPTTAGDGNASDGGGHDVSAPSDASAPGDASAPDDSASTITAAQGVPTPTPTTTPAHDRTIPPASGAPPGGQGIAGRERQGAQVKLLVRVDLDTFLRGYPVDGETCELDGCGPIPMAAVHDLVAKGDPLVAVIVTRGRTVYGVAHLRRQASAHQKTALEWLYPSCAVAGCTSRAHLEIDHRADWARTHYTALDLLDCLCKFHHGLKTRGNWALTAGHGKRALVAPDDPRHPQYRKASGQVR